MHRPSTAALVAIASVTCIQPEQGIDNSKITGEVIVPARLVEETRDPFNEELDAAVVLDDLGFDIVLLDGKAKVDDEDWFTISSPRDLWDQRFAIELADSSASVRFELYALDFFDPTTGGPPLLDTIDLSGSGQLVFPLAPTDPGATDSGTYVTDTGTLPTDTAPPSPFDADCALTPEACLPLMAAGESYGVHVVTLSGSSDYRIIMPGAHPDEAGILVGAWGSDDVQARGLPLAGSNATGFVGGDAASEYAYTGSYEMFLVRAVLPNESEDPDAQVSVDEGVKEAWLFAGSWSNLNTALAARTWYSSEPYHLVLDRPSVEPRSPQNAIVYQADPLTLDALAPIVIGFEIDEVEPNDQVVDFYSFELDVSTPGAAQDIGVLSGGGFVDIVHAQMEIFDDTYDYVHDADSFQFTVPEPVTLLFTTSWDVDADLDVFTNEADGGNLEFAWTANNPEAAGGAYTYEPGEIYFLSVLGYTGPVGTPFPYTLEIEQFAAP